MASLQTIPIITQPEHDVGNHTCIYPTSPSSRRSAPPPWDLEAIPAFNRLVSLWDLLPPVEKVRLEQEAEDRRPCARDQDAISETSSEDSNILADDASHRPSHRGHVITAHDVPVRVPVPAPNAWKCCQCGVARWTKTRAFRPSPFSLARETERCAAGVVSPSSGQGNGNLSEHACDRYGYDGAKPVVPSSLRQSPSSDHAEGEARECRHVQCSACEVGIFARARRVPTTVLFGVKGECWEGIALETGWELDFVGWKK
ncbi:hypothetical protein SODALDRAFT_321774 [Sodiomyces alkalinus F11]|uniref:Uncharacterized protein n=1 Tax=Sodiomyces alkalinus (strain CBS 110278 / VKM F-3762 / F11) TaxID=1314773 RepID=A0A3N2Q0Y0_SODAK|nr:hypothetical protein SODALDRAFT_321774 [Sodiomyces alkalinus F11]ROT40423.1 hypothetical protein SODALDRAFT_321774 [Sodiomyces alkalinus F11]